MKLSNNDKTRNYSVSELNHYSKKWLSDKFLAIEMRQTQIKINKLVYLGIPFSN